MPPSQQSRQPTDEDYNLTSADRLVLLQELEQLLGDIPQHFLGRLESNCKRASFSFSFGFIDTTVISRRRTFIISTTAVSAYTTGEAPKEICPSVPISKREVFDVLYASNDALRPISTATNAAGLAMSRCNYCLSTRDYDLCGLFKHAQYFSKSQRRNNNHQPWCLDCMAWRERVDENVRRGLPPPPRPGEVLQGEEAEMQRRLRGILAPFEGSDEDEDEDASPFVPYQEPYQ
ncbi:uncharacterized protein BP5553_08397 [Venustampulla echinocandica]|uniref:Stc1 domain-containing protein n=1 Tax=Venustampulla echinocandica TaxID=2656787 RepID=A0A370TE50_9HELO|nr:uncharacterized protein BP5553_08397 [Venustampulla echinocandica]RDL32958.1 hypothetical protein BP5553_08397 [Venustampulla echinocandica]